ncbi:MULTISPECIES: hypothetical protein [Agrobacterium]|jgi:hypothetical protein|uniref:BA14K family protein n=2 Tax=Agrobacterium TaxID=357 RepID=A0AAJ2ERS7_9HYPH|nr:MULTISPECIES: hypothetical protein [Agrobacterium]KQM34740.1 hypothetical protein ASE62_00065 [Rhizobium sp. Leaf202]KQN87473.1 hypothetical protein ASF03_00220 [Rhizobium sp. Leaf68]KQR33312.1 hypothetical protein ASF91_04655 [Rhizobium sp. Leaf155]KQZ93051.1 hypothetical protein ASD74_17190 [Rhizobium sp. Root564]MDQ1198625.1 hypothetical protein [Rhizobium sp. SORGH_AS_0787]MQB20973.1 hypothetical protein [Agrobacterium tumefaciens]
MWTLKNRFVTAGLVALTIAGTTIATTSQAEARNNFGRGLAAGIAGTLVGGALLSAAHDRPVYGTPVYAEPTYYGPPPVVYEPVYPRCHVAWRQDGFGDMYRVRVCD